MKKFLIFFAFLATIAPLILLAETPSFISLQYAQNSIPDDAKKLGIQCVLDTPSKQAGEGSCWSAVWKCPVIPSGASAFMVEKSGQQTSVEWPHTGSSIFCSGAGKPEYVGCFGSYNLDGKLNKNAGDYCFNDIPPGENDVTCRVYPTPTNPESKSCCSDVIKAKTLTNKWDGLTGAVAANFLPYPLGSKIMASDQCCAAGKSCCKAYWNPIHLPGIDPASMVNMVWKGVSYTASISEVTSIINSLASEGFQFCAYKNKRTKLDWRVIYRWGDPEISCNGTLQSDLSRLIGRIPLIGGIVKWPFTIVGGSYYYKPCGGGSSRVTNLRVGTESPSSPSTDTTEFKLISTDASRCSADVYFNGANSGFKVYAKNNYMFMDAPIDQPASVYAAIDSTADFTVQSKEWAKLAVSDYVYTPTKVAWYWNGTKFVQTYLGENSAISHMSQIYYLSSVGLDMSKCTSNVVPARFQTFLNSAPRLSQCPVLMYGDTNNDQKFNSQDVQCVAGLMSGGTCGVDKKMIDLDDDGKIGPTDLVYELGLVAKPDKWLTYYWSLDYDKTDVWVNNMQACLNMENPATPKGYPDRNLFYPPVIEPSFVSSCGDGICSNDEVGSCPADCGQALPTLAIISVPDSIAPGGTTTVKWSSVRLAPEAVIKLEIISGGQVVVADGVKMSVEIANSGQHIFPWPNTPGGDYQIRLSSGSATVTSSNIHAAGTISSDATLTFTSGRAGINLNKNQTYRMTWSTKGVPPETILTFTLLKGGQAFSYAGVAAQVQVENKVGGYDINFPEQVPSGNDYNIRVTVNGGRILATSPQFSIGMAAAPVPTPTPATNDIPVTQKAAVTTSPSAPSMSFANYPRSITPGKPVTLTWTSANLPSSAWVKIEIIQNGQTVSVGGVPMVANVGNIGSHTFNWPNTPAGNYQFRLSSDGVTSVISDDITVPNPSLGAAVFQIVLPWWLLN